MKLIRGPDLELPVVVVFPGGIAGASLKRDHLEDGDQVRRDVFPGGIAGASLKRLPVRPMPVRPRTFSPAESPGPH